jgi:hypothetical protein
MTVYLVKLVDGESEGMVDVNRIIAAGPSDGGGPQTGTKSMLILQAHKRGTVKMYFTMSSAELVKQLEGAPC